MFFREAGIIMESGNRELAIFMNSFQETITAGFGN